STNHTNGCPKKQVVVQKTTFAQAAGAGAARNLKNSNGQTSSKNCSLNRDVECQSVGTIFANCFSERSAHCGSLTISAKENPETYRPARRRSGAHAARCWQ